jgi:hypothetical protein
MGEIIRLYTIEEVQENLKECKSEIVAHVTHQKKLRVAELRNWAQAQEFLHLAVQVYEKVGNCTDFQNLAQNGVHFSDEARSAKKWHDENPGRWPQGATSAE